MQNKNFRKILALASLMAVTGLSSAAFAQRYVGTGGPIEIKNNVNTANTTGSNTPWAVNDSLTAGTNDSIKIGGVAKVNVLELGGGGIGLLAATPENGADVANIDINGFAPSLSVGETSTIGSITNSVSKSTSPLSINNGFTLTTTNAAGVNGKNQTQNAGDFSGLGDTTIGVDSEFAIGMNSQFANNFEAVNANSGKISVAGNINAGFTGSIGKNNALGLITIGDNSTATFTGKDVNANSMVLYNQNSTTIFDSAKFTGNINGENVGDGIVRFKNTSSVNGAIGATAAINAVYVDNAQVTFGGAVSTKIFQVNKGTANLNGDISSGINYTDDGVVNVLTPTNINGAVKTNQNNTGTLNFANAGSALSVGDSNLRLKSVQFTSANTVTLTNSGVTTHYATEYKFTNAAAILRLAADHTLDGKVVATSNDTGAVIFNANGTINSAIGDSANGLRGVGSTTGLVNIVPGEHYMTVGLYIGDAGPNAGFNVANNANIHITGPSVTGISGGIYNKNTTGTVNFAGSSLNEGVMGNPSIPLDIVNLNGGINSNVNVIGAVNVNTVNNNAGGNLTIGSSTNIVNAYNIGSNGGTVNLNGDANHTIAKTNVSAHGNNPANINIGNNVGAAGPRVIDLGMVGDATVNGSHIDSLVINGSSNNISQIILKNNSSVKNIAISNNTSALTLQNGSYKIGNVTPQVDGNGILYITDTVTLQPSGNSAEVNYGTSAKKLNSLEFDNNAILNVSDKVNIYANNFVNPTSGNGTINFLGVNKFFAPNINSVGATNLAAGGNLSLLSSYNSDSINLGDNSALHITSNVTSKNGINPLNANNGVKIYFDNMSPLTVQAKIGNNNVVDQVYLTGSDVAIGSGQNIMSNSFVFATNMGSSFTLSDAQNLYNIAFVNNSGASVVNTIVLNQNVPLTTFAADSSIATENDGARKINVQLSNTSDARILTPNTHGAIFTTSDAGGGDLTLDADGGIIYKIGTETAKVGTVNFNESSEVRAGLFATDATMAAGKTFTLGETIDVTNGITIGSNTSFNLSDGAMLKSVVNGAGVLNVGFATIEKDIGTTTPLVAVNFSDNDSPNDVILVSSSNINAADVNFNKGLVVFNNNAESSKITGNTNYNNSNVNLLFRDVTVTGDMNFTGNNTLSISASEDLIGDTNFGRYVMDPLGSSAALNVDPNSTLTLVIDDTKFLRTDGNEQLTIIENLNPGVVNGFTAAQVTVKNKNPFITYKFHEDDPSFNNGLRVDLYDNTAGITKVLALQGLTTTEASNLDLILKAPMGTDAYDFTMLLARLLDGQGGFKPQALEALRRLEPTSNVRKSFNDINEILSSISERIKPYHFNNKYKSSGDENYHYGMWAAPFMSGIERKTTKTSDTYYSGYRGHTNGVNVGYDTQVQDDMVLGFALSKVHSDVTMRDFKNGDKVRSNMIGASLYGMKQIDDTWYAKGIVSFANNRVKNHEKRMVVSDDVPPVIGYSAVNSKYNSKIYAAEALFGYDYQLQQNVSLDPVIGARYARIGGANYTEYDGINVPNLTVKRKATNRLDFILGARITGKEYTLAKSDVIPEAHAFVSHGVINQNKRTTFIIEGAQPLSSFNGKIDRTQYNVGLSLNADLNSVECGVGYDSYLSKKHTTHRGTLKLRINF